MWRKYTVLLLLFLSLSLYAENSGATIFIADSMTLEQKTQTFGQLFLDILTLMSEQEKDYSNLKPYLIDWLKEIEKQPTLQGKDLKLLLEKSENEKTVFLIGFIASGIIATITTSLLIAK